MDKNAGVLEKWWAIRFAELKAQIFCLFHWRSKVLIESRWVECRTKELTSEFLLLGDVDTRWREEITFVGVCRGSFMRDNFEIVRWYYGNPRFDTGQPEGGY